jgi:hypothetical protein
MLKWNANFQIPESGRQVAIAYVKFVGIEVKDNTQSLAVKVYADAELTDEIKDMIVPVPYDLSMDDAGIYAYLQTVFENSALVPEV